jgi:hypothetical protein
MMPESRLSDAPPTDPSSMVDVAGRYDRNQLPNLSLDRSRQALHGNGRLGSTAAVGNARERMSACSRYALHSGRSDLGQHLPFNRLA